MAFVELLVTIKITLMSLIKGLNVGNLTENNITCKLTPLSGHTRLDNLDNKRKGKQTR